MVSRALKTSGKRATTCTPEVVRVADALPPHSPYEALLFPYVTRFRPSRLLFQSRHPRKSAQRVTKARGFQPRRQRPPSCRKEPLAARSASMHCIAIMNGDTKSELLRNDPSHTPSLKRKVDDRGSDELLGQAVSNGSITSPQGNHGDNNNDAKKVKLDNHKGGKPSRVVHIRNLPGDATEADVVQLGIPFGKVTNILQLKGKNQAFLEMAEEAAATSMVDYFAKASPTVRGRVVYVQYSNHRELKTESVHPNSQGGYR